MPTVPCQLCGLQTAKQGGICHRHGDGAKPNIGGVSVSRVPPIALNVHRSLAGEYEEVDGVISPSRIRQYAVKQMRVHMTEAIDQLAASEFDVIDPNERHQRIMEFFQWTSQVRVNQDVSDKEYDIARSARPTDGRQIMLRGMIIQNHLLGKEWELGRAMGVQSDEGVNYSSASKAEFVSYAQSGLAEDRVLAARRYLQHFHPIVEGMTGRPARNSAPLDSSIILDGYVADPMSNNDYAESELDEIRLIQTAEAETARELQLQQEEQELLRQQQEQERREKMFNRVEGVFKFGKEVAQETARIEREKKAAAMIPDQEYQQAVVNQERRRQAAEERRRWGI